MGDYPIGAQYDRNAPYNQPPTNRELYGDEANEIIDQELQERLNENFIEWVLEYSGEDFEAIISSLQEDVNIADRYRKYRFSELVEELASEEAARLDI